MTTTKPSPPDEQALCGVLPPRARQSATLSPLARAALANGVAFDDVAAYLSAPRMRAVDVGCTCGVCKGDK